MSTDGLSPACKTLDGAPALQGRVERLQWEARSAVLNPKKESGNLSGKLIVFGGDTKSRDPGVWVEQKVELKLVFVSCQSWTWSIRHRCSGLPLNAWLHFPRDVQERVSLADVCLKLSQTRQVAFVCVVFYCSIVVSADQFKSGMLLQGV